MATLLPQLTALMALQEMNLAIKLYFAFNEWADRPEWKDGWTFTKSFLVVKGGIGVIKHNRHYPDGSAESANTAPDETTNRRHSRDSGSEKSMDLITDKINDAETNRSYPSDRSSAKAMNTASCKIIGTELFLLLAVSGRIRYEDFPTTDEINDKSKADWFSKCAAAAQLVWFFVNLVCRGNAGLPSSVMEILVMDWIILGIISAFLWWSCPQNVHTPYIVPIQDYPTSAEAPTLDLSADLAMGVLLGSVPADRNSWSDKEISEVISRVISDGHQLNRYKSRIACFALIPPMIIQFFSSLEVWKLYWWHPAPPQTFWMIFTCFNTASEIVLISADPGICFNWATTSMYQTYIRPFVPEPPQREEIRTGNEWLSLPRGIGIYSTASASEEKWQSIRLRLVVVAAFVILLCHLGKLVIALTAFISAPEGIYKVPGYTILEVLGHVGG